MVERYNAEHPEARIVLPASYSFNEAFSTIDVRIMYTVAVEATDPMACWQTP
jgi:hypothetical protein